MAMDSDLNGVFGLDGLTLGIAACLLLVVVSDTGSLMNVAKWLCLVVGAILKVIAKKLENGLDNLLG